MTSTVLQCFLCDYRLFQQALSLIFAKMESQCHKSRRFQRLPVNYRRCLRRTHCSQVTKLILTHITFNIFPKTTNPRSDSTTFFFSEMSSIQCYSREREDYWGVGVWHTLPNPTTISTIFCCSIPVGLIVRGWWWVSHILTITWQGPPALCNSNVWHNVRVFRSETLYFFSVWSQSCLWSREWERN